MIAEAKGMGARGRGLSWTGALARPLRPELSAQGKAAPRAGVAVCPRALSRCPAPLGTGVPVPERLQLPPVWRIRVEGAGGAAAFGLPAQPLPPSSRGFIFIIIIIISLARPAATSIPKSPSSARPAQGSISSSDISSSRHLGPCEGGGRRGRQKLLLKLSPNLSPAQTAWI